MSNRIRTIRRIHRITHRPIPQVNNDPLAYLEEKFSRLEEIRKQIAAAKELHKEHDQLVEELLPLFVTQTPEGWIIKREIVLGTRTTPPYTLLL